MIEKEFIPYELALELKQLGFNEPCFATIDQTEFVHINGTEYPIRGAMDYRTIDVPTFSQAFRWFREKDELDIHIKGTYFRASYVIGIPKNINYNSADGNPLVIEWDYIIDESGKRKTYEEAELACLRKLIEIVKK